MLAGFGIDISNIKNFKSTFDNCGLTFNIAGLSVSFQNIYRNGNVPLPCSLLMPFLLLSLFVVFPLPCTQCLLIFGMRTSFKPLCPFSVSISLQDAPLGRKGSIKKKEGRLRKIPHCLVFL
jgi:hypothetical protein